MILKLIFASLFGLWAFWVYTIMTRIYKNNIDYLLEPSVNFIRECPPAARYDAVEINRWFTIAIGVFMLPFRLFFSLLTIGILYLWVFTVKQIYGVTLENNQIPRGSLYLGLQHQCFVLMRVTLFFFGYSKVNQKKVSIYDLIADYKPIQDTTNSSIAVSNHCSWLDMFIFLTKPVSFLSKLEVAKTGLIGMFSIARQCLFLNRKSKEDRERILDKIQQRGQKAKNGTMYPLLIFPEGTVSNGRVLMKFKKGAFSTNLPIKIYCLKYSGKFIPSLTNAEDGAIILLSLMQPSSGLTIYEVEENFDPLWVAEKHGLSKDDPELWKYVAQEVKEIISFITGFNKVETGFRDLLEFEIKQENRYAKLDLSLFSSK